MKQTLCYVNSVFDKRIDKERRGKRKIKWKKRTHLFDMPSLHPSQNPSEGWQHDGKKRETMSVH